MDGPGNDPAEWNKSDSERQLLNVFSDIEDERVEGALSPQKNDVTMKWFWIDNKH